MARRTAPDPLLSWSYEAQRKREAKSKAHDQRVSTPHYHRETLLDFIRGGLASEDAPQRLCAPSSTYFVGLE